VIRPARDGDLAALAGIEAESAPHPWSATSLAAALAAPTTRALVSGEPPSGHVIYSVVADEGEILTLAVRPERRRGGLGRALVDGVVADWRASGVVAGWLEVRADNAGARALYAAAGFVPAGVRAGYYADGHDALVYRWTA
jgi:[ribosomal protein S18]-alanine N-acetyltransferase